MLKATLLSFAVTLNRPHITLLFFFLGLNLRPASCRNFLQIPRFWRFKKTDSSGTYKNAALLDFPVKAA